MWWSPAPAPAPAASSWTTTTTAWTVAGAGALGYVLLCRALRFGRERAMLRRYRFAARAGPGRMTVAEAQAILEELLCYEFPEAILRGSELALFKTYAVETISSLLTATGALVQRESSRKRFEDTAIIINEFCLNPPGSRRAVEAIARMNWLHSRYRAAGRISDADMLYTLSVLAAEPIRFIGLYEWRALNDMERCAFGTFWKHIGDAMGIRYDGLLERAGWSDGLDFLDDLTRWSKAYEVVAVKPSAVNVRPAEMTVPLLTFLVPGRLKDFAAQCVHVLLGDRVREAFLISEPALGPAVVVYTCLWIRRFCLRHLSLPRLMPVRRHARRRDARGRIVMRSNYGTWPFYVRPSVWKRWGPGAWAVWLAGGRLPGDDPDVYQPDGFLFSDLGPTDRRGRGKEEMREECERLLQSATGGCPFS